MKYYIDLKELAEEIKRREHLKGGDISPSNVKRTIGHIADIMSEEWRRNFGLSLSETLRESGHTKYKVNKKSP